MLPSRAHVDRSKSPVEPGPFARAGLEGAEGRATCGGPISLVGNTLCANLSLWHLSTAAVGPQQGCCLFLCTGHFGADFSERRCGRVGVQLARGVGSSPLPLILPLQFRIIIHYITSFFCFSFLILAVSCQPL